MTYLRGLVVRVRNNGDQVQRARTFALDANAASVRLKPTTYDLVHTSCTVIAGWAGELTMGNRLRSRTMLRVLLAGMAACGAGGLSADAQISGSAQEWPTYGHDAGGMRYSPLTQIDRSNVSRLGVAWIYHMRPADYVAPGSGRGRGGGRGGRGGDAGRGAPPSQAVAEGVAPVSRRPAESFPEAEVTPLVVGGLMYVSTPYGRVVALDPTSGKEIWAYKLPSGNPASRGVEYFAGDAQTPAQIVVPTSDGKLFTLDAKTGILNAKFGENGIVNLATPEMTHNLPGATIGVSSPPVMYGNLIIVGGRAPESSGPGPAGDVRAFDIHDGKLVWTFHSIPQPGEPNYGGWVGDSAKFRTGVNVWGFMTVDVQRGIVYMPFGAPSGDLFGGDRPGSDLYDTSLVAADARTGKYLWHFQVVHHDMYDFDLEAPPVLMDVRNGGRTIPAVAIINKASLLFLLDRTTGKPIYGVEERAVPQSKVPLEKTSPTQPFPVRPAPLARQGLTMAELAKVTPELETACRKLVEDNHLELNANSYAPPGYQHPAVTFPSEIGGANWGGASFNPQLGYLFVNVSDLGQILGMQDPPNGLPANIVGTNLPGGRTGPYSTLRPSGRFKDTASNMPCNQPPWGEMVAVNVNTGNIAWKVPLGITETLPAGQQNTGRPGIGGSIATASGLIFVGATDDRRFRALDARDGKELWQARVNAVASSVPATYQGSDGRQYVAVAATGSGFLQAPDTSDELIVYALK
jgi:quinoprotein glucose dehydrogenase